jgi:tRNA1Val (adenine37-N6)-methyltransferase
MHSDTLSPEELAEGIRRNLKAEGKFTVLYPPVGMKKFEKTALENGLYLNEICEVKHQANHETLRVMAQGSFRKSEIKTETICIKELDGTYSREFTNLLKPYYLIFD